MPGKGRATGYSDFYKNSSKTPSGSYGSFDDEEENDSVARAVKPKGIQAMNKEDARKAAIKRRLQKLKASK